MVRGSGAAWDLRKSQPYECYEEMEFDIPIGKNGDCFDRYLIRMEEMRQSAKIMKQCCDKLNSASGEGPVDDRRRQDRAAEARRHEALDGSADPSLQALHRGLQGAGRRGLRRGRGAEGRVRRLSVSRRHQQALPLQDCARRASRICRRWISCAASTCWPTSARSSARSTSCSARSTDEGAAVAEAPVRHVDRRAWCPSWSCSPRFAGGAASRSCSPRAISALSSARLWSRSISSCPICERRLRQREAGPRAGVELKCPFAVSPTFSPRASRSRLRTRPGPRRRSPNIRRAGRLRPSLRCSGALRRSTITGCRRPRSRRSPRCWTCRKSACSRSRPSTRCSIWSRSGATTCSSAARRRACCAAPRRSRRSAEQRSARSITSAPTARSPGSRSSASAPAAMRRWCRSTTTITRI